MLHRLADEPAHRRDPLSRIGPSSTRHPSPARRSCSSAQIRSSDQLLELLVGGHLQVQAADLRRAHRVQREAVLVPRVDQLVGGRRRLGEDPEPAERVRVLVLVSAPAGIAARRRRGSRRSPRRSRTRARAARRREYVIAAARPRSRRARRRTTSNRRSPPRSQPRRDQVLDDLLLAVDRDRAPPVSSAMSMRCVRPGRRR